MTDRKISQLASATTTNLGQAFPVVQSSTTRQIALGDFAVVPVASVVALKTLAGMVDGQVVNLANYYDLSVVASGGGGGQMQWLAASTATPDNGVCFQPDAGGAGRWRRTDSNPLTALKFGCRSSADSQTAFDALLSAGAGDEIWIDTVVRVDTGACVIPDGTNLRFLGKDSRIDYRGTGAALEIRNSKNVAVYDPHVDLTNAGANAIGLWVRGCWFLQIYKPKTVQSAATHTGILLETSQTGGNDWGTYLVEIHNPQFHRAASTNGLYGLRTRRTSGDAVSVTHLNVYGGWSKGNDYGMYLRDLSGGKILGFAADTGIDGINIDDSGQVVLIPGELGGSITGYSINIGSGCTNVSVRAPDMAAAGSLGYTNYGDGEFQTYVQGISATAVSARNLRGFVIIADAATTSAVTFTDNEVDNAYFIVCSIAGVTGAVAAGSLNSYITAKATSGFTINLEAAPGAGTSVQVNWIMIR